MREFVIILSGMSEKIQNLANHFSPKVKDTKATVTQSRKNSSRALVHPNLSIYPHLPSLTIQVGRLVINVFNDERTLNQSVADHIRQEMKLGGLIVLPSDSTHGNEEGKPPGEIYEFLDKLIAHTRLPENLEVTHMDELKDGNTSFSASLRNWLPKLMEKLKNRFHAIDINNFGAYQKLMNKGPRVIVGGVGAGTPPHVAYIGEEQLNNEPQAIKLRPEESKRRNCSSAFTMGLDSFNLEKNKNLETVIITAKGERKVDAVAHALNEALGFKEMEPSACGQILKQFANTPRQNGPKIILNLDEKLFRKLPNELQQNILTPQITNQNPGEGFIKIYKRKVISNKSKETTVFVASRPTNTEKPTSAKV